MAKKKANKKKTEVSRIPIITILGHVDHGKTTILDKIRESDVQSSEVGGITQKVSVFTIETEIKKGENRELTFIDTPGHEAFDLMRSRGGTVADVVMLVVAANDGIQPQTKESIEVIKKSGAKVVVVLNKMDLPNVDVEKVKRDLATEGIQVEGYGGSTPIVEVSGETGEGIDDLLSTINLVIDVEGLAEREELPEGSKGRAYVLESEKDSSLGYTSSIVVVNGIFSKGDMVVFEKDEEYSSDKIKGFVSETGKQVDELSTGSGGKIIGAPIPFDLGDEILSTTKDSSKLLMKDLKSCLDEEESDDNDSEIKEKEEEDILASMFGDESTEVDGEEIKALNIIIKASSEGCLEAVESSLREIEIENAELNFVKSEVGDINQKDIEMAIVSKSIVLGFEVCIDTSAKRIASDNKVLVRSYDLIYKLIEEVQEVMRIMVSPKELEEELGLAEIKEIFTLSNGDIVLGGRVKDGKIELGKRCYIVRNDEIIGEGKIVSMRSGKNDVKEAGKGSDFGIGVEPKLEDIQEGDEIHCFEVVKQSY